MMRLNRGSMDGSDLILTNSTGDTACPNMDPVADRSLRVDWHGYLREASWQSILRRKYKGIMHWSQSSGATQEI